MPTPEKTTRSEQQRVSVDVLLDIFCIGFGYNDRDSIQIRLEKDGTVYVCDVREGRKIGEPRMLSGHISWELFQEKWPDIVRYLLAEQRKAAAQAAGGEDG